MKSSKKGSKVVSTKPLQGAGSQPEKSALIGGLGNTPTNHMPNYGKKGGK
jgi:hypothetical protein